MIPINVHKLAEDLGGKAIGFAPDAMVAGFVTDSNQAKRGDLFIAIKGERVDGHEFVQLAVKAGAAGALTTQAVQAPHILVADIVEALAKMALARRETFDGPVIGISGSAGKTTTKELVAAALTPFGPVLKTQGNRNTEFTAPLVWANLQPEHRAAVIEMSMRGFGQIAHLAAFSKPTVGVITNIGFAHLELVESREGIAVAKGELLEALGETGTSVLWHEDDYLDNLRRIAKGRVVTFGTAAGADCRIVAYRPQSWSSLEIGGSLFGKPWLAKLQAVGRHVAIDAAAAVLAASVAGVKAQDAADALQHATFPPMRMEITDMNGATVLLDTYNASPPSMIAAIQTLHDLPVLGRRMAVIGEMKELGEYTEEGHRSVGRALVEFGIDEVIFYGPAMDCGWHESIGAGANRDRFRVANSLCDVTEFLQSARSGDAVLIKGSRALELERALPREGVSAK